MKVEKRGNGTEGHIYVFHCPGCGIDHHFTDKWRFDGNMERPTVMPSIITRWVKALDIPMSVTFEYEKVKYQDMPRKEMVCHLFIEHGWIKYLSDCTHELAGHVVELPDLEE